MISNFKDNQHDLINYNHQAEHVNSYEQRLASTKELIRIPFDNRQPKKRERKCERKTEAKFLNSIRNESGEETNEREDLIKQQIYLKE